MFINASRPVPSPIQLPAKMRERRADVLLTEHAFDRSLARARILPSRVREMIAAHRAVVLPWQARECDADRTYHLLYDKTGGEFVIAVLASNASGDPCAHVVTVLTRVQFENDAGPLSKRARPMAASLVLDPVAFRSWELEEFGGRAPQRRFPVILYFSRDDQPAGAPMAHMVFQNAPVCGDFADEHSLSNAAAHPGFWEWYRAQAARAGLPVERVVAIRIADTFQVKLDVSATPHECPCRARHSAQSSH